MVNYDGVVPDVQLYVMWSENSFRNGSFESRLDILTDFDSASSTSSVTPRDHLHDEVQETTEEALEFFYAVLDSAREIHDPTVQLTAKLGPNHTALKISLVYDFALCRSCFVFSPVHYHSCLKVSQTTAKWL